jgi:hypothetical protein
VNAGSSRNGHNDMVPESAAPTLKSSLKLVSEVVPQMHACYKLIAGVVVTES